MNNPANNFTGVFTGNGAGLTNIPTSGSAWQLTGDAGTTAGVNFLGTTDNQPLELKVNGSAWNAIGADCCHCQPHRYRQRCGRFAGKFCGARHYRSDHCRRRRDESVWPRPKHTCEQHNLRGLRFHRWRL